MNQSSRAVGGPLEPSVVQHCCRSKQMQRTPMILAALMLVACAPDPDMAMQTRQRMAAAAAPVSEGDRVTVERIGVFKDDLAYSERRGVYVIRDKATGREFIGVSGIGIAEVAAHQSGKVRVSDER